MEAKILPIASLDDIVFEGRNKAYGAYVLRQEYPARVKKAIGISLLILAVLLGTCYSVIRLNPDLMVDKPPQLRELTITLTPEPYIPKPLLVKPPSPVAAPAPAVATTAFREVKIVTDVKPIAEQIPDQHDFTLSESSLITAVGELPGTVISEDINSEPGESTEIAVDKPFKFVEQMPEFPEGLAAMYKFINKHLRYPPAAQAQGLQGNVILTSVVSATGQISDIKVIQDIGGGAGEEASRVIRKMPAWHLGMQQKRAVPVQFTLPIRFKLQ